MLYIYEVHFNHDSSNASNDAINIRQNQVKNSYIKAPEWMKGYKPKPAAYALNKIKGNKVTIKTRFAGGPGYSSLKIRAVDYYKKPQYTLLPLFNFGERVLSFAASMAESFLSTTIYLDKSGKNILGSVREKTIKFDSNGFSKFEEFELNGHQLNTSTGVGIFRTVWKWQYYDNGKWVDFSKTEHRIYTIFDTDSGSWSQEVTNGPDNIQLPWVDALEVACSVAAGATNVDEITKQITEWVNDHPLLVYHGNNNFVAKGVKTWDQFNAAKYMLSLFLKELKGNKTFSVNCLDCANAVIAFSNLLGADLKESRFYVYDLTRPIIAVGGDESKHSEWKGHSWGWHAVAFVKEVSHFAHIYDATLKIDLDLDEKDKIHRPRHPANMIFGLGQKNEKNYVNYLLKDPTTNWPRNTNPIAREVR